MANSIKYKLKVIKDPIYGNIPLSYIDSMILSSLIFNRLHNIRQNGIAYMVYPGAITTRFLHSIGVMHLATECFIHAFHNANIDDLKSFLKSFKNEIEGILIDHKDYIADIICSKLKDELREEFSNLTRTGGNKTWALYNIFIEVKRRLYS